MGALMWRRPGTVGDGEVGVILIQVAAEVDIGTGNLVALV